MSHIVNYLHNVAKTTFNPDTNRLETVKPKPLLDGINEADVDKKLEKTFEALSVIQKAVSEREKAKKAEPYVQMLIGNKIEQDIKQLAKNGVETSTVRKAIYGSTPTRY